MFEYSQLSVDYHPNGKLGGDLDLIRQMKENKIQIVVCQTAPMVSFVPEVAVFDLPMVFAEYDGDQIDSVINGRNDFRVKLNEGYEDSGLHLLGFLVDTGNENLKKEMEISIKAGELVGRLYDAFYK